CRGINLEIQQRHAARCGEGDVPNAQVWYDPVTVSAILEEMAEEAGVVRLYNAMLASVETSDAGADIRIEKVIVQTKAGALHFSAKTFVDATGDADVVFFAGGKTVSGDEHGVNQP
ncbi:MAG: hypothetical protein C4340_03265, partial [Armatimonadota bacterium]